MWWCRSSLRPGTVAKDFTHKVALSMEKDDPARYLATATKARRNNRIFVDYLRNSREATAIAPYSTRARAGAPVAMPLDWSDWARSKRQPVHRAERMQRLVTPAQGSVGGLARMKQALPKFNEKARRAAGPLVCRRAALRPPPADSPHVRRSC